jgi:hypothetical protein
MQKLNWQIGEKLSWQIGDAAAKSGRNAASFVNKRLILFY